MPEFSLIIPVYNVQDFLVDCLESCINQTFRNIEVICINDCSPDDSYKILDDYARKDPRIKIITHSENKGLGGARNTGIETAIGKYCWFIDSDDSILLNACEILYEVIEKTHADIIRFNSINYLYDSLTNRKTLSYTGLFSRPFDTLYTKNDCTKIRLTSMEVWHYIIVSSLLKTVRFRENVIHEDIDFTPILFSKANSIYYANYSFYYRRIHSQSITQNNHLKLKRIVDRILAIKALYDYVIFSNLPKSNFCTQALASASSHIKEEYNNFPEIHNFELDSIIKRTTKFKKCFEGDMRLYDSIINTYGNSRLLEFILKSYRFIVKRVYNTFRSHIFLI